MYQLINNADITEIKLKKNYSARKLALQSGNKFYFTGIPCPKGHIANRFTSTCNCCICQHEAIMKNQRKYLVKRYGLTLEEYNRLLLEQKGLCAICENEEITIDYNTNKPKTLSIDHCHKTGKVRKLLCHKCNISIGHFNHDPKLLRKAALYCEEL